MIAPLMQCSLSTEFSVNTYFLASFVFATYIFFSTMNDKENGKLYTIKRRLIMSLMAAVIWPYIFVKVFVKLWNK